MKKNGKYVKRASGIGTKKVCLTFQTHLTSNRGLFQLMLSVAYLTVT